MHHCSTACYGQKWEISLGMFPPRQTPMEMVIYTLLPLVTQCDPGCPPGLISTVSHLKSQTSVKSYSLLLPFLAFSIHLFKHFPQSPFRITQSTSPSLPMDWSFFLQKVSWKMGTWRSEQMLSPEKREKWKAPLI